MECYSALQKQFAAAGYHSYRLSVAGMEMHAADSAYVRFLRTIKTAVDPSEILAPGRYVPVLDTQT